MVWSISISNEGYQQIREALKVLDFESLCKAIGDTNFEIFHGYHNIKGNPNHKGYWNYRKLMNDRIFKRDREILEDLAFDFICRFDSCDNGGFYYWIDPEGYHRVDIEEGAFSFNDNEETIEILLSPSSGNEETPIFDHMKALTEEENPIVSMQLERDSDIYRFSFPLKQWEKMKESLLGFYFYFDDLFNLVNYRIKDLYLYLND
jgi:hypothetical protein